MGLLTLPFRLPLLPVQGVIRLAELIQEEAERELANPVSVRQELETIEQAEKTGELSEEEVAEAEQAVVSRLPRPSAPGGSPAPGERAD